jgi:hypothetical protein
MKVKIAVYRPHATTPLHMAWVAGTHDALAAHHAWILATYGPGMDFTVIDAQPDDPAL